MKMKYHITWACFAATTIVAGVASPLAADTVYLKNGRTISNVQVEIRSGGVRVRHPDGRLETLPARQLARVQMGPVRAGTVRRARPAPAPRRPTPQTPVTNQNNSATAPTADVDQEERDRVARASTKGDTWRPRPDAERVHPFGNLALGLLPVYSGLYRTGSTGGAIAFSVLEAALLVNALDFATATRDAHVWNRYDTLAGGLALYDLTQDGVLIPAISGPALLYLNGGLSNQITDMRGGITRRRLMRAQAADLPPFSKQEREFSRLKRQAYGMLALALLADGFASYLSASEFNLGSWSGPHSQRPTTPAGRALRSLVLPGWGQFYSDQALKASIIAGTAGALVIASGLQSYKVRRARQAYESSIGDNLIFGGIAKLSGYSDETGYLITRAISDPLRENAARQERDYRNILGLTAAFWIYNVVDALLGPGAARAETPVSFSIAPVFEGDLTERRTTAPTLGAAGVRAGISFLY